MLGDALGGAQKQIAASPQRKMEQRNDPILQIGVQIDQQVTAGNQIDARERSVLDEIMRREDTHLAQFLDHAVSVSFMDKPARQPLGRYIASNGLREAPDPRCCQGRSEEHTSELQSLTNLVCRLLLEKKKKKQYRYNGSSRYIR